MTDEASETMVGSEVEPMSTRGGWRLKSRVAAWVRACGSRWSHVRIKRLEIKLEEAEAACRTNGWGREAIVDRMNRADAVAEARWQHLLAVEEKWHATLIDRIAVIEARVDTLCWGREALVERVNYLDVRDECRSVNLDERLRVLDGRIRASAAVAISDLAEMNEREAEQLDALAISRRLAMLEDHVERLFEQLTQPVFEARSTRVDRGSIVAFPPHLDQQTQKEAI